VLGLPTTLFGFDFDAVINACPPPPCIAILRLPCPLPAAELGLVILGVPPSGVDCALSTRDFLDEERGVMLLLRNA